MPEGSYTGGNSVVVPVGASNVASPERRLDQFVTVSPSAANLNVS